jgi:hypothetical protein
MLHALELAEHGFEIPETFIFGDAASAERVVEPDGEWISKGCSGVRTKSVAVDTSLVTAFDRLALCPSLFQRRVRGVDVRVHVAGNQTIGLEIESEATDYRYAWEQNFENSYREREVPRDIHFLCVEYCNKSDLLFSGIDFKIEDGTGRWVVLEANPMPGYDFFDRKIDGKISAAVLRVLQGEHLPASRPVLEDDDLLIDRDRRPDLMSGDFS